MVFTTRVILLKDTIPSHQPIHGLPDVKGHSPTAVLALTGITMVHQLPKGARADLGCKRLAFVAMRDQVRVLGFMIP